MEWSPPSASGTFPASSVLTTSSACFVQVAVISFKYLACVSPSFFCSGMATGTLPPSSTSCPSASRRASSPATRTADGPMSTPRRDWPRSRGTPMTRIFRGVILVEGADVVIESVLRFGNFVIENNRQASKFQITRLPNFPITKFLRVEPVQHSGKRNGLAHVFQAANPGHGALNAHAEAAMGHAAKFAQVEIPLERFFGQVVFVNALQQQFVGRHALRAADDFPVAFGREHIHAQSQFRPLRIGLHVERFHLRRISMHHDRLVELC